MVLEIGLWLFAAATLGGAAWMKMDAFWYQATAQVFNSAHRGEPTAAETGLSLGGLLAPLAPPGDGEPIGTLRIPRLGLSVIVAEGTSSRALRRAVGRLPDSGLPAGTGNIAIAGHRDTFFRPLEHIEVGDEILLETAAGYEVYAVEWTSVVGPRKVSVVDDAGYSALTLVTCYPFRYVGFAPERFVVRARRTELHAPGSEAAQSRALASSHRAGGTAGAIP
jgi:sortase A